MSLSVKQASAALFAVLVCLCCTSTDAAVNNVKGACAKTGVRGSKKLELKADNTTVHWGYYFQGLKPAIVMKSGDEIMVEMITHHAGDDYDKMIKGDPGMESIYRWDSSGMGVPTRGASGKGDGVHVLTGPIHVCGAEPGDVLQVDILDLWPRVNPSTKKTYGSNAAAWWGYHFRAGFKDGDKREVITIYEVKKSKSGKYTAVPDYQFRFNDPKKNYSGPTSPCVSPTGFTHNSFTKIVWANKMYSYSPGVTVPCINKTQKWEGYYYPGLITQHPTGTEDYSIRGKFKVPVNFHIGNMGLTPKHPTPVDSVPPMVTGGNMDNRRIGKGASMYYPVQVPGALLTMGDAHTAQGDSELDGTGIETSINGLFKVTLHKKAKLPTKVKDLKSPLLENKKEFVVHGYTYNDYLNTVGGSIYGKSSIDLAMTTCYNNTRDWLMGTYKLTEDQAITLITVGVDFGITQVVDGNWGVHAVIPKKLFPKKK